MSTIRDQPYFGGALLDVGFADTRGLLRDMPQGTQLYQITPSGNRGNYFASLDRHFYRQQWIANLFLPTLHLRGSAPVEVRHRLRARGVPPDGGAARLRSAARRQFRGPLRDVRGQPVSGAQELRGRAIHSGRTGRRAKAWCWRPACARNGTRSCATWNRRRALPSRGRPAACATPSSPPGGAFTTMPSAWTRSRASRTRSASPRSICPDGVGPRPRVDVVPGERHAAAGAALPHRQPRRGAQAARANST